MSIAAIVALIIFIAMFILIVMDKIERHYVTLICGGLILAVVFGIIMQSSQAVLDTLNVGGIAKTSFWYGEASESTTGVNWATIVFILGMMVMVEGLGKAGFFRWLCLVLAKAVKYKTVSLLVVFMIMSAVLSMFIDSITVVLFLAAVTVELSKILRFNPIPMILSEIFCANLGGCATMCGDPPNIIIGTSFGYSFADFMTNNGPIVLICFIVVLLYFVLMFRKELRESEKNRRANVSYPQPNEAIENKKTFVCAIIIFAAAVILLVTHAQTTLTVACIGVIIAAATLISMFALEGKDTLKYIVTRIDYRTLLFFVGLFLTVGGLEQTGVLEIIAGFIGDLSGGNIIIMVAIIIWISAIASAFIDNIPFAATMVPVIESMAATTGVNLHVLAYTLSMGTDIGGNMTPIGASANVVGTSVSAKAGHPIGWGRYMKACAPITFIVVGLMMVYVFIRYC